MPRPSRFPKAATLGLPRDREKSCSGGRRDMIDASFVLLTSAFFGLLFVFVKWLDRI
jgi:hypothetical protein